MVPECEGTVMLRSQRRKTGHFWANWTKLDIFSPIEKLDIFCSCYNYVEKVFHVEHQSHFTITRCYVIVDTPQNRSETVKPEKWDDWPANKQKAFALYLIETARGHYLLAQALFIASHHLKESDPSDAQDMEVIGKTLFAPYWQVEEIATELAKQYGRNRKTSNRRNAENSETVETEGETNEKGIL